MNLKNKIELLAPSGDMDSLKAAIIAGADAIYIGGKSFGARALAKNFNHDEITEAVKLCHLHGVKLYVTINTMLYEKEINNVFQEIDFLYQIGIDALIVSDLGLINLIKKRYPDIEVHVSTQAHIHNLDGAKYMQEIGVDRIVLARETNLNQVKEINKLAIDTEVFVHGALCVSYSGQCLMGSVLHSRSGNRGVCSQACRMRYRLYDETSKQFIKTKGEYLLSPKDLYTLELIHEIIESGTKSIKIEGRMKRSEYVALVTRIYRLAIDAYYNNQDFIITEEIVDELKLLFNRGFTKGYLNSENHSTILNPDRPNHIGLKVGKVIDYKRKKVYIKFFSQINQGDGLKIVSSDSEDGLVANKIYKKDKLVNKALANEIVSFEYKDKLPINSYVYKTTDIKLLDKINNFDLYRRIRINIYYKAKINEPFYLEVSDGENVVECYGDILQASINAPISHDSIFKQLSKLNDTVYEIDKFDGELDNVFIKISSINALRREAIMQLNAKRMSFKKRTINNYDLNIINNHLEMPKIIIEITNDKQYQLLTKNKKLQAIYITKDLDLAIKHNIYYLNPNINYSGHYSDYSLQVASEAGSINKSNIAYYSLNVANSLSISHLLNKDYKAIILSLEISDDDVNDLIDKFNLKYGFKPNLYVYCYGKRPLMSFKDNILYDDLAKIDKSHGYSLVDIKDNHYHIVDNKSYFQLVEAKTTLKLSNHSANHYLCFNDETDGKINDVIFNLLNHINSN